MSTGALTELHAAVKADDRAQVEAILKAGGDVNTAALDGRSALYVAAESDSVAVAKLLLAKGAVISAEIKGGWRALHVAASKNNSRVAKLLASKGASLDAADELGRLPLHIAAQNNSVNTIKVLISSGASLETALKGGWRPLHIAANKNYGGVAKILLDAGASADCPDEGGWTPLHVAASRNSVAVAKQLLAKGASAESESEHGWKPLHAAANRNSVDVAKCVPSEATPQEKAERNATLPHRVCWEYDFHSFLPEELYEKFGVASYSSQFSTDRVFTRDSFESVVEGVYTARVRRFCDELDGTNGLPNILAIEAYAASEDTAWQQLIWYILNLEKVLDSYRGLWITRPACRFSSVIPDMLGKNAIDTIISACSTELDRTVHVHGLVEGLDLPNGG
ncbi:hypothetical protein Poli38472_010162 [Pythium oligandrum]|uniref:Ankyrin repeat protein n=1 Tax=Pythium oligandrum TaxID=41045 RepID=A0A8K1FHB1_PYTOL|nr:hypothetical protein Poli38472_010162 [Pythium oligandrum]|eukprot:TMW58603.1 hypothetical protein Poli38472_010162 [Pythium oligandrum]